MHGIIDYIFGVAQLTAPGLLGFNKGVRLKEGVAAAGLVLYSALTDYPAGVKKVIPFKTHRAIDIAALGGLALLAFTKDYRSDKRAQIFQWGMIAAGR